MSKTTHARFSPSTLDALSRCIKFKYLEFGDEEAANEGTMLHAAFETGNLNGLDDEQKQSVQAILDLVECRKAELGGPDKWDELKECRVQLKDLTFGTADRALIHRELPVIVVIDAKFTRRRSEHDMQLKTYAAALVETLQDEGRDIEKAITIIAAPRIGPPETEEHDAKQLLADVRQWITDLYERIDDPFNPPTPHEDLCAKCARASRCPALTGVVKQAAVRMGLPLPSVFDPDSDQATDRDRCIAQVLAGVFSNWADQIKKNNTEYVRRSGDPKLLDGFQMVRRSSGLRIGQEFTPIALAAIMSEFDVTQDIVLECSTITLGTLAKRLSEQTGRPEADIKEKFKELLGDFAKENFAEYLTKTKRVADETMLLGM